jgi:hypothetical protein
LVAACGNGAGGPDASDAIDSGKAIDAVDTSTDEAQGAVPDWHDLGNGVARADVGTGTTDDLGKSPVFTLPVPPAATGFVVTVRTRKDVLVTVRNLTGPKGAALVPKNWLAFTDDPFRCLVDCPNRVAAAPGEAAFLFPNTPVMPFEPGPHTLELFAFTAANDPTPAVADLAVSLDAVARPDAAIRQGTIDLNLCLSGALGIHADIALQHTRITAALAEAKARLLPARIQVGDVRAFDVALSDVLLPHDRRADLAIGDALAQCKQGPLGIPVVFVQRIYVDDGQGIVPVLGVAGGIPGPTLAVGGRRTGVVVALELGPGQPDQLGRTLAHEIGHFLGLYHTTEAPGPTGETRYDEIPDTKDGDADNLMHWAPGKGKGMLTPQQATVLHGNPWVQGQ